MEESNVNNLNGVPNFGHGIPEDGDVGVPASEVDEIVPEESEVEQLPEQPNE